MQKMQETRVRSLGWEDPLEKDMAAYFSILAWEITWTEEPGGFQSIGVAKRVKHNWVTKQHQSFGINSSFVVTLLHLNSWISSQFFADLNFTWKTL